MKSKIIQNFYSSKMYFTQFKVPNESLKEKFKERKNVLRRRRKRVGNLKFRGSSVSKLEFNSTEDLPKFDVKTLRKLHSNEREGEKLNLSRNKINIKNFKKTRNISEKKLRKKPDIKSKTGLGFYTKLKNDSLRKFSSRNNQNKDPDKEFSGLTYTASNKSLKKLDGDNSPKTLYEKIKSKTSLRNLNEIRKTNEEFKKNSEDFDIYSYYEKFLKNHQEENYLKKHIGINKRGFHVQTRRETLQTLEYCHQVLELFEKLEKLLKPIQLYKRLLDDFSTNYIMIRLLFDKKGEKLAKQTPFMLERCINWKKYHRYGDQHKRSLLEQRVHGIGIFDPNQGEKKRKMSPIKKKRAEFRHQFSFDNLKKSDFDFYSDSEIYEFYEFLETLKLIYMECKISKQEVSRRVLNKEIDLLKKKKIEWKESYNKTIKDDRLAFLRYLRSKERMGGVLGIKFMKEKGFNYIKNGKWKSFVDPKILKLNNYVEKFSNQVKIENN